MLQTSLHRSNKIPLYHQVAMLLRTELAEGRVEVGAKIPPEHDLMQRFSVSRITIRQAIDSLVQEGILVRKQGRGTFVLEAPRRNTVTELAGTLNAIETLGENTDVSLLGAVYVTCPPRIAQTFKMAPPMGTVLKVTRVRSSNGEPFEYLTNWIAPDWTSRINLDELRHKSLVSVLKRLGAQLDSADQIISATLTSPEVSECLGAPVGSPLLQGHRIYYAGGVPVMVLESLYRPDRYAYRVRLSAAEPLLSEVWVTSMTNPL